MYDKVVSLGSRLHYPITITKLLKSPGDAIRKQDNIIEYKFSWRRRVGDDEWCDETTYTEFDSPAEGRLKDWRIREGQVISADTPCMTVEEACGHEVQIQGLCSLCGADMTEVNWASEAKDTDRAMINMTHDQTGLMVSESVATRAEHETQRRLLRQRKLSLVVDLDQTIIHACIEPTVGEWQRDASSPNHEAVRDVQSFQLNDDGPRGLASGCTYYIKLRPGLRHFLAEVATMYELHVYTMGTRAYALNIARIVDPDRRLFGNRVISRDENGSITSKSLQRLFPVSTNMVVIIDDRADVWPRNRPNLIKVVPYDFFKGIGDINSSFLPKRTDLGLPGPQQPQSPPPPPPQQQQPPPANGGPAPAPAGEKPPASPLEELARMGDGADSQRQLRLQAEEQEKTLERQLTDRPLLHMQEELDREDERAAHDAHDGGGDDDNDSGSGSATAAATAAAHHPHHRQHLLTDDDEELVALQDHLTDLHTSFYETYDRRRKSRRQAEPTHPPPGHHRTRRRSSAADDGVDLSMVPDVGDILDELKSNVLSGLVIVMSGLVPLGVRAEESEIGMQAQSFGAQVLDGISRRVTHLVVSSSRPRTRKVQQAARIPTIKIVSQNWLTDCLSQWRRLDESPYYMDIADADRQGGGDFASAASASAAAAAASSSASAADDDDATEPASEVETEEAAEARDLKDFDWATADKDLEEFLDEDDGDDDEDDEDGDDDGDGDGGKDEDEDGDDEGGGDVDDDDDGESSEKGGERSDAGSREKGPDADGRRETVEARRRPGGGGGGRKRKKGSPADAAGESSDGDGAPGTAGDMSVLAKKQRLSRSRGTSALRSVRTPNGGGAVAVADTDADADDAPRPANQDAAGQADFDEDDLERDLLAELEAAGG